MRKRFAGQVNTVRWRAEAVITAQRAICMYRVPFSNLIRTVAEELSDNPQYVPSLIYLCYYVIIILYFSGFVSPKKLKIG